jgi:hypothetical protein
MMGQHRFEEVSETALLLKPNGQMKVIIVAFGFTRLFSEISEKNYGSSN